MASTLDEGLDDTPKGAMMLCSSCFDVMATGRILAIVPQQTCEVCGKKCLGYKGEVEIK